MSSCNCPPTRLGVIAVTVRPDVCQQALYDSWHDAAGNKLATQTAAGKIRYNLCTIENKAGQYILDLGHWIWAEIRALWQKLQRGLTMLWQGTAAAAHAVVKFATDSLQWLLKKTQELLNWLIAEFESNMLTLAAFLGIALGLAWFGPEILEGVGSAYEGHYRHVAAKAVNKRRGA